LYSKRNGRGGLGSNSYREKVKGRSFFPSYKKITCKDGLFFILTRI
jgi:hypothetical protein